MSMGTPIDRMGSGGFRTTGRGRMEGNLATPLLQEELEPEKEPPQTHHLSWELGD